ncbi:MAG: ATP-binding cassette domain-containing protein, partial [Candidatus Rokuibacteriota bacterium]
MSLLAARGLSKRFGGLHAVAGLDLTVGAGEMLGLIGPNGAGKTTVFNLLSGMLTPDAGDIVLDGRSIVGLPAHAICRLGLARTFQIVRPFPRMTVLENLQIGAAVARATEFARDLDRVMQLFPRLADRQAQRAGTLSGGEQQMLAIGRA